MILLSKFNHAGYYFDKVKKTIHNQVQYIVTYRYEIGRFSIPWLEILLTVVLFPIASGLLYIENHFYSDISASNQSSSRAIFLDVSSIYSINNVWRNLSCLAFV